jgi:2-iminobutanoate/2-iminopropanoate deaminase
MTQRKEKKIMGKEDGLKRVSTSEAPSAIGPYSQGVVAGDFLFISGQLPLDPATGEFVQGNIEEKTRRVLTNIKAIAEAAGTDLNHAVKTTIFLKDLRNFASVNAIYAEYFKDPFPARSTVEVSSLPKGGEIEIEAVLYVPRSKK